MADHGPLARKYLEATEAFNSGDTDKFGALLLAETCVFDASGGRVGSTAAEIVAALKAHRAAVGWEKHEVLSSIEDDDVLAVIARNTYTGGGTVTIAGIARFKDGKAIELHSAGRTKPKA
jgi:hypothetical protein